MRAVYLIAGLLAAAGNLCASATLNCALSGLATGVVVPTAFTNSSTGCWSTTSAGFINATYNDSLSWGAPTTQGGLGTATLGNKLPVTTSGGVTATTQQGFGVGLQLAPNYSGASGYLVREDNAAYVWSSSLSRWLNQGIPNVTPSLQLDPGHFNAPGPTGPSVAGAGYGSPYGDQLVELPNGGPLELTFLNQGVFGVWFRISSQSGLVNTSFGASVEAFDSSGNVLGTYSINAGGSGGQCGAPAAGAQPATGLFVQTGPVPCNDAPYVGFYDPQGRIKSIYISVTDPTQNNNLIGFAIDSLTVDEVPEPSIPLMIGGGLAAFFLWKRWRRAPAR